MDVFINRLDAVECPDTIKNLKSRMQSKPRFLSVEQAKIITDVYKQNQNAPAILKRALALREALLKIEIEIDPDEWIVGNRACGSKTGVVFPEAGVEWVYNEIDTLPTRPQDKFNVRPQDKEVFFNEIYPFWKGNTLEDETYRNLGADLDLIAKVVKLNQKDHAQGHICPNVEKWLQMGPNGLKELAQHKLKTAKKQEADFYKSIVFVMEGACQFIRRYAALARKMALEQNNQSASHHLLEISRICDKLSSRPPETFHEAVQAVWFLFVILQMESNASSFSPGRLDQILYPYYRADVDANRLQLGQALLIMEAVWIKFNEIVYLRNKKSADFFAGFPIGFNVAVGGQLADGTDAVNELTYIILKAQEHLRLPQPNLSARIHPNSPQLYIERCAAVVGLGTGMPQFFNDYAIIPALEKIGLTHEHAMGYAITGCVEITTPGNNLGYSDAAMFNMVKVLELTLNNGVCMQSGKQMGLQTGILTDYNTFAQLEQAYARQMDYFIDKTVKGCEIIEKAHIKKLPSPFLSSVIDNCMEKGVDVTAGGALYNYSGIQAIQAANLADCFAALKSLVFDQGLIAKGDLLYNLRQNYPDRALRQIILSRAPRYGNDIEWVDLLADKWIGYFSDQLKKYKNYRGGPYHAGLYTVSAHVPMGFNVAATPDGRKDREPLADGGLSAVCGRDTNGPTALLRSVERIHSEYGTNGTLLNMRFSPSSFQTEAGFKGFCSLLKTFATMKINHVQFNVFKKEDLIKAKKNPADYRNLLVRVAGYSAYFTDLSDILQDEIIARTEYGT